MAAIAFPKHAKTLTLSTNHTYSYILISPRAPTKSTILFLHGFPSSSYDWRHQVNFFAATGHGVLVPDLLGYGGTSKPSSATEYKAKGMAAEIIEILDHEGILDGAHAVSHDMGSILLSRLANYFPDRLLSTTFLVVPYSKPGERFDLEAVNDMTKQLLGKERFGYIGFFVGDCAGALLDEYSDSFFTLFYPRDPDIWNDHMGPSGAMEAWLRADRHAELAPYITEEERNVHQQIMVGYHTFALNWYQVLVGNLNVQDELEAGLPVKIPCPTLMILPPALADQFAGSSTESSESADDLTIKCVSTSGHWVQIEARDEVNSMLLDFFERVDSGAPVGTSAAY